MSSSPSEAFDFEEHRRQWREVPGGAERVSTPELSQIGDEALNAMWMERWADQSSIRSEAFYYTLYPEFLRGKRVLELGSGMGFDGIHFTKHGADWTFCDIAQSNLDFVGRMFGLQCPGKPFNIHLIDEFSSFAQLQGQFDVIWANGSLLTIPFELAREESLHILPLLKPGGRWIELTYPRVRWEREGAPPFSAWGAMTDGVGKPWMEWYELPKLLNRMKPARFDPLLSFNFISDTMNWFDLVLDERAPLTLETLRRYQPRSVQLPLTGQAYDGTELTADSGALLLSSTAVLWSCLVRFAMAETMAAAGLVRETMTVEVDCEVLSGTVGFSLTRQGMHEPVSREQYLTGRPGTQTMRLQPNGANNLDYMLMRNGGASPVKCIVRDIRIDYDLPTEG